jgi:hypothetical protein
LTAADRRAMMATGKERPDSHVVGRGAVVDPRLNSIHLEPPRRQRFRAAREMLLGGRGPRTLGEEQIRALAELNDEPDRTLDQLSDPAAGGLQCYLVEGRDVYPLKVGINTLGRALENDVILPDRYISRRHCAILVHAGSGCELHDMASRNGTYLNDQAVSCPARLHSGDCIRLCDRRFVFYTTIEDEDDPKRPTGTLPG